MFHCFADRGRRALEDKAAVRSLPTAAEALRRNGADGVAAVRLRPGGDGAAAGVVSVVHVGRGAVVVQRGSVVGERHRQRGAGHLLGRGTHDGPEAEEALPAKSDRARALRRQPGGRALAHSQTPDSGKAVRAAGIHGYRGRQLTRYVG